MRLKRGLLAGIALCCMPLMTACSAKDTIGILVGNNSEDTKKEEVTVDLNAANIDDSVEKPQITSEMGDPVTYDLHATADALTVEATVSEGTLSYQWYRNNVDSMEVEQLLTVQQKQPIHRRPLSPEQFTIM